MAPHRKPTFTSAHKRLLAVKATAESILGFAIPEARLVQRGVAIHKLYLDGLEDKAVAEIESFITEIDGRMTSFLRNSPQYFWGAANSFRRDRYDPDEIARFEAGVKELQDLLENDKIEIIERIAVYNRLKNLIDEIVNKGRALASLRVSLELFQGVIKSFHRGGYDTDLIGRFQEGLRDFEKIISSDRYGLAERMAACERQTGLVDEIRTEQKDRIEKARIKAEQVARERRSEEAKNFLASLGVQVSAAA